MSDYYDAFEMSPVPLPGPDAVPPEPFHGIYGMPMFATVPTADLTASLEFWTRGLGFFEIFGVPERLSHLRRWAFQDVLLVAVDEAPAAPPAIGLNFSCVLSQLDGVAAACRELRPDAVEGPRDTPWNTRDVEVITPENARVVITAAKVYDPASREARNLADMGIAGPGGGENGAHV